MEPEPSVLESLRRAVDAMPDDVPLRLHLATMLLRSGQHDEAVRQLGAVLQRDPGNAQALGLLRDPLLESQGFQGVRPGAGIGADRKPASLCSGRSWRHFCRTVRGASSPARPGASRPAARAGNGTAV